MYFFIESLRSAINSLRGHFLRTGLTMLGIMVGVTTIITIVSIIAGLDGMVAREFSRMGTRVLYVSRHQWGENFYWRAPRIGTKEIEALECVELAEYVVPTRKRWATISRDDIKIDGMQVVGTTENYHLIREIPITMGRFFSAFEAERGRHICVIGYEIYNSLFKDGEDPINKYIEIYQIPFRVIGVVEKQGNFLTNMSDIAADNKVFIPLTVSDRMFGRWWGVEVMVSAPSDEMLEETEDECRMMLRVARGLRPGDDDNFGINKQDFMLNEYRNATKVMWAALIGIAALSLLVGGIGVMNIMLISVTERTKEIGVRKALGAKRTHILSQFLFEALIVCWIGGAVGALVGLLFAGIVTALSPLVFVFSGEAIALGFAFTSAVGIFFGLYPAVKAARKSPVEALRYE
ncbi:hypothetical protein DRQ36_03710 [bacterium]|nr:MAG: hypothetical protein DRQ36_03710 [bacterium]